MTRGDAAGATWLFLGCIAATPTWLFLRQIAATPTWLSVHRGDADVAISRVHRGDAAAATRRVARLRYSDDDSGVESGASGAARLELRYVFGSDAVKPDASVQVVADPAACAIRAGICGGAVASKTDATTTITDPDGYSIVVSADAAAFGG